MHRSLIPCSLLALLALAPATESAEPPRLVLQITVDGLRADLIHRYADNFGKGGFRYLLENGTHFTNAHYQHANTETIVGHTTLATGATPAVHGMVGNVWYHADSGEVGSNIEDSDAPLLPTRSESQVDPAQLRAACKGIPSGAVARPVHPVDVAPTLSALLGLPPPAAAQGTVLHEVMAR